MSDDQTALVDIYIYIEQLPEPQRGICHAVIIDGESIATVAKRYRLSSKTILRRARKALAVLAAAYDISGAKKYLPATHGRVLPPAIPSLLLGK